MSRNQEVANVKEGKGFQQFAELSMTDIILVELDGMDGGFDRIKIPSAGSTVFEVPGEDAN